MAGSKNDLWENTILDWQFGGTAVVLPGTVYPALWTATLSDASTQATAGEVSGTGYARPAVARNSTNFNVSAGGTVTNKAAISFGTAGADWGTIVSLAVCSAPTGGTMYYWADVSPSKIIQNGDPVQINAGDLSVSES